MTRHTNRQTTQCEEKEQASGIHTTGILKSSDQELNTTTVNTLQALTEKADGIQGQVGKVSREENPKN